MNQWWICDRGRGGYQGIHHPDRLFQPTRQGDAIASTSWHQAIPAIAESLRAIVERHGASAVGVMASGELTNEECFLARSIFRDGLGIANVDVVERPQPPVVYPKFTIEGDKNPNTKGARVIGLAPGPRGLGVKDMIRAAAEGSIRAMVFLRGGPLEQFGEAQAVAHALGRLELLVVIDILPSPVSERAHWVLPGVSFAEREGTYTNSQGRVQRAPKVFALRVIRARTGAFADLGRARRVDARRSGPSRSSSASRSRIQPSRGSTTVIGDLGAPLAAASADVAVGDRRLRRDLLLALPKTDLHVHLDGSLRPGTLLELAKEQGVRLAVRTPAELKSFLDELTKGVSLTRYLEAFDLTLRVLQEKEALERAAFELAEDAHKEQVRYMEVRYCPALHTRRKLTMEDSVEAVARGLERARARYGIRTGTIICGIRHLSPRLSYRLAELAVAYGKGVVAFDLAGAEKDYPAKRTGARSTTW